MKNTAVFFSIGKMDPKQQHPDGWRLVSLVIHYLEDVTREVGWKKYQKKLLRDHPETLRADFKR